MPGARVIVPWTGVFVMLSIGWGVACLRWQHTAPKVVFAAAPGALIVLAIIVAWFYATGDDGTVVGTLFPLMAVIAVAGTCFAAISAVEMEGDANKYDATVASRNAMVASRLSPLGITLERADGDNRRFVVSKDGCTASYQYPQNTDLATAYPLVPGTGSMVSGGCPSGLDGVFVVVR